MGMGGMPAAMKGLMLGLSLELSLSLSEIDEEPRRSSPPGRYPGSVPPLTLEEEVGGSDPIEVETRGRPFLKFELSNLSPSPSTRPLTRRSSATFNKPGNSEKIC